MSYHRSTSPASVATARNEDRARHLSRRGRGFCSSFASLSPIPALGALLLAASSTAFAQENLGGRLGEPCYIVLATDVSGSMNVNDPLVRDSTGETRAIRDDAQITFLQLLPFLRRPNFVSVVQFTDEVSQVPLGGRKGGLVSWDSTRIDWDRLRPVIQTVETKRGKTRVDKAMEWAERAIERQRAESGAGKAALVFLSDGDPDAFRKGRGGGGRSVQEQAEALRKKGILVYPVIINKASFRPGRRPERLSVFDQQAEHLMESVAKTTHGKAYEITPSQSLLDIFLDILGDQGKPTDEFAVSKYHRSVVVIGSPLESVEIESPGGQTRPLTVANGRDASSGVEERIVPLTMWDIVILRRPLDLARVDEQWAGRWKLDAKRGPFHGRVYLVPDFLLQFGGAPYDNWWVNQDVAVRTRIAERPTELVEEGRAVPRLETEDLLVQLECSPLEGGTKRELHSGELDGRTFESEPFAITNPGRYRITAECFDRVGSEKIPLGTFTREIDAQPSPVRLRILAKESGSTLLELPVRAGGGEKAGKSKKDAATCEGGDSIVVEVLRDVGFPEGAELSGIFRSSNVAPGEWKLERDGDRWATPPIELPITEKHLAGEAAVEVNGRVLRFEDILLAFGAAPLRIEHEFLGGRGSVWIGERVEERVSVSALPIFPENAERVASSFPETLPEAKLTASGNDVDEDIALEVRRTSAPQRNGPALEATYEVVAREPVPPGAETLVLDPGTALPGLRGDVARLDVIDPVEAELFRWSARPAKDAKDGSDEPGVADRLYDGEPVRFGAVWADELDVRAVTFEIHEARGDFRATDEANDAAPVARVELPIGKENRSQTSVPVAGLVPDTAYRLDVIVAIEASDPPADPTEDAVADATTIHLAGGVFRYEPRRLELVSLEIGEGDGVVVTHAHERVTFPIVAKFSGWNREEHFQALREFEKSCAITLDDGNDAKENPRRIDVHWTRRDEEGVGEYVLEGEAAFCPEEPGLLWVEIAGELEAEDKLRRTLKAATQVEVAEPAIRLRVVENGSGQVLYDSAELGYRPDREPLDRTFSQRLNVEVERLESQAAGSWPLRVVLERTSGTGGEVKEAAKECVLEPGGNAALSFDPVESGRYSLRLEGRSAEAPSVCLATPELIDRKPPELIVAVAPPATITPRTRQWPFEYRVPIGDDWPGRPEAMAFDFRLPGIESWISGRVSLSADGRELVLRSPEYLPPMDGVESGSVVLALRMRLDGGARAPRRGANDSRDDRDGAAGDVLENVWTLKGQVVRRDPKLGDVALLSGGKKIGRSGDIGAGSELHVGTTIGPRPERWELQEITAYLRPLDEESAGALSQSSLYELGRAGAQDAGDLKIIRAKNETELREGVLFAAEDRETAFFGWPRLPHEEQYVVAVAASYREPGSAGGDGGNTARTITEWSDAFTVSVRKGLRVPASWWILSFLGLWVGGVWVTKRKWIPSPDSLGVNLSVAGGGALDPFTVNPTYASVKESMPLRDEMRRWVEARNWPPSARRKALWSAAAFVVVPFHRYFIPVRRSLVLVRFQGGDRSASREAYPLLVQTGVLNRSGRWWGRGQGWRDLPAAGARGAAQAEVRFRQGKRETKVKIPLMWIR